MSHPPPPSDSSPEEGQDSPRRERRRFRKSPQQRKYRRARVRNFLFTVGPNRLSRGRISQRHLAQNVVVRQVECVSPHWPRAFDGLRIGHVSDFHLGELLPLDRALEIVSILDEVEPDLVACTGDVVDLHHDEASPLLKALAQINTTFGNMLVLGNHDELHCGDTLASMAEDVGLLVLRNEAVELHHNGGRLVVAGTRWTRTPEECAQAVEQTCGDETHLLLAHNPKAFPFAAQHDVALTLSGHTHGGQVALKGRPARNLAVGHRHSAGPYLENGSCLYVTVGVGAWFPLRVNCPAEVAVVTMRHGPRAQARLIEQAGRAHGA